MIGLFMYVDKISQNFFSLPSSLKILKKPNTATDIKTQTLIQSILAEKSSFETQGSKLPSHFENLDFEIYYRVFKNHYKEESLKILSISEFKETFLLIVVLKNPIINFKI